MFNQLFLEPECGPLDCTMLDVVLHILCTNEVFVANQAFTGVLNFGVSMRLSLRVCSVYLRVFSFHECSLFGAACSLLVCTGSGQRGFFLDLNERSPVSVSSVR